MRCDERFSAWSVSSSEVPSNGGSNQGRATRQFIVFSP
jgi:hypothetical protein